MAGRLLVQLGRIVCALEAGDNPQRYRVYPHTTLDSRTARCRTNGRNGRNGGVRIPESEFSRQR